MTTRLLRLNQTLATKREIAQAVNQLIIGRSNAAGTVTLTPNAATTTLERPYINANSVLMLMPVTANAAAESPFVVCTSGLATIHHANNAFADKTFNFSAHGG